MTSTLSTAPEAVVAQPPQNDGDASHRRRLVAAAVVLPPLGATVVLLALHHAATVAQPDNVQFALLWAGFLCGMLPLVALACSSGINGVTRTCALAGIGLLGTGRVLRLPGGPLGNDEFIHMRQIIETYLQGEVGHGPDIFAQFPGLHQTISAVARLTGSPLWPAALAVIALAHVLSILAVYQLVRAVGASPTGAAVGAVVYTLNPSWLYFDTSISYESLALPLMLWCLAAAVTASRADKEPSLRYIAVVVLCAAALPVIHHLTTIMLFLTLTLLSIAVMVHSVRRIRPNGRGASQEHLWPLLLAASSLLVSGMFWWSDIRDELIAYLSPSLTRGWAQVSKLIDVSEAFGKVSGTRLPFAGAQNPIYETVSGILFPFVVFALFLVAIALLWVHRRRLGSAPWGFAALGAMFFLSIPMALTSGGGEGAHRSWAFSFIGIAVVCGLAWSFGPSPADVARFGPLGRGVARLTRPGVRVAVVGVMLTVLYIGGAALGTNVSARFPGNMQVGDDARSVSREGAAVAAWLEAHAAVDSPVVADRYVSQQVGSWVGRMHPMVPSASFPLWDLYMNAEPVRRPVLKQVLDADVRYFIVDARMATTRPRMGFWFIGDEPGAGGTNMFPQAAIDRFNCLPWLRATFAAGPLTVYRVDASILRETMAGSCERGDA
ncbi:hypothetical protein ACGFK1_13660 [Mycobacterium sp. NPDC048908]|uniref:hypothetical protein n=1 Tax=Mycobacterium sp. NPDC048908 TaxID=3364292 RepID=UPI0037248060